VRISDSQKHQNFARSIEQRLYNLNRIQEEMGLGQSLLKPSEDVRKADDALRTQDAIAAEAQFQRNIDDGKSWASNADSKLQSIMDLITEIDTLALAADNSAQTAEDRDNSAIQIDQKLETLMGLVNATDGQRYLFAGTATTTSPFSAVRDANGKIQGATANAETIAGKIYRRIGAGEDIQINIPGSTLFQPTGGTGTDSDLFHVVAELRNTIANNNTPPEGSEATLSNEHLREQLSVIKERISDQQTSLGSIVQRLDQTTSRLKDHEVLLTDRLENAQGVDMTDLVTRLATEQGAYDAIATVGTKLLKNSLIDYIG
jgi:flagellar hook-associated protein 3 FlgL